MASSSSSAKLGLRERTRRSSTSSTAETTKMANTTATNTATVATTPSSCDNNNNNNNNNNNTASPRKFFRVNEGGGGGAISYKLTPLRQRRWWARYDVLVFALWYATCLLLEQQQQQQGGGGARGGVSSSSSVAAAAAAAADKVSWQKLLFPLGLVLQLCLVVWQQWRVQLQCRVGYAVEPDVSKWTHVLVEQQQQQRLATGNSASNAATGTRTLQAGLTVVQRPPASAAAAGSSSRTRKDNVAIVDFHHIIFRYEGEADDCSRTRSDVQLWNTTNAKASSPDSSNSNNNTTGFYRLHYPIDLDLSFYTTSWKGHSTLESVQSCEAMYGPNATLLELPSFTHLLHQQLVAPFFLFQLVCVVLWSLDEYWYYAMYTLVALLLFESTVAYNRKRSVERLRTSMRHEIRLYVYRCRQWMAVNSSELVPGDIVSLKRQQQQRHQKHQQQQTNVIPADVLLLQGGTAVVDEALLTGESVPQLKTVLERPSSQQQQQDQQTLHVDDYKQNIVFGGTVLVSHIDNDAESDSKTSSNTTTGTAAAAAAAAASNTTIPSPPDRGIVGFVLRTGFETAQGSLLRTMAYSSQNSVDGIHTRDTFYFVGLLLICALVSALHVLNEGWKDETRNRFRLVLHVIIIITSVVPPELPMELSLAVTNSVADLIHKCRVYCTEPFRIPWAGQVNVCCFDKTGTITSDSMQFQGVRLLPSSSATIQQRSTSSSSAVAASQQEELVHPMSGHVPWETVRVMAACHSLAWAGPSTSRSSSNRGGDAMIGDPMEAAVLRDTGYTIRRNDIVVAEDASNGLPQTIQIRHRFAFSSRLKRMTVLVTEDGGTTVWALTKGAPETIQTMLAAVPENYEQVYTHHMGCGQRVLAMGYRKFEGMTVAELKDKGRDYVEQDFCFAGFLVLDCPLKADSKSVITELRKSSHRCVMITGDAVLTAAEVARQVGIIRKKTKVTYVLQEKESLQAGITDEYSTFDGVMSKFEFIPLSVRKVAKSSIDSIPASDIITMQEMVGSNEAAFCMTGAVLAKVATIAANASRGTPSKSLAAARDEKTVLFDSTAQIVLKELVPCISVFARHAPRQKEAVIAAFNLSGKYTLMCGDGTNDVGALKRAHVGISIISAPDIEDKHRKATAKLQKKKKQKQQRASTLEASLRQLQEAQDELDHVELGDASVASPFTSRAMSIKCCKDVLQQGRCTLVTMLQIYKILGVNCLVNALVLTKLHMHGVKQGDRQLTILGLAVAALFFFVTRGKPLPTLSPERPPSSVLCAQALLSIAAQFAVHLSAILLSTEAALAFVDPYDPSMIPDGSFNANVLNTCTFLLTMVATVNTFLVNYKGRPFMEDFRDNKMLFRGVQICHAVIWICALEVFPPLNDLLQLAPFPETNMIAVVEEEDDEWVLSIAKAGGLTQAVRTMGFPMFMCCLLAADTAIAYGVEKGIARLFS